MRWVVLKTPWWECLAAGLPFLVEPGDSWTIQDPQDYLGPLPFEQDVILNPHRCPQLASVFYSYSDKIILYETENMLDSSSYWPNASESLRARCPHNQWFNYSAANSRAFGDTAKPLHKVHDFPTRPKFPRPIDVLFVGSMNARRENILEQLRRAGIVVYCPTSPVFGVELTNLEACSKLLLNIHYYTPGIFEAFRVVPAVHRGTPVLSEDSVDGEGNEWCKSVPYENLVEETLSFLKNFH
jgi:hypothetical protein